MVKSRVSAVTVEQSKFIWVLYFSYFTWDDITLELLYILFLEFLRIY